MACCQPISRGMRTEPCTVGTPSCTSGNENEACSEAMTKSHDATMVSPKPMAGPLTAAMTGFHTSRPDSSDCAEGISQNVPLPPPTAPPGSLRSAPAQKAAPAPVTMPTQASSSSRKRAHAALRSARSSVLMALRASGRL